MKQFLERSKPASLNKEQAVVEKSGEKEIVGSDKKKKSTIAALDGVRAVATLSVLTFHINSLTHDSLWSMNQYPLLSAFSTFGGSGVTLFFVLSGFLLFLPYAKALLFQERWPAARQFYLRRALRIIPGYYVALFLMILLFQPQYLQPSYWKRLALFLTFLMDSSPATWRQLNGPFWTLAVEWQFYMLLPVIAFLFYVVARRISAAPQQRLVAMLACCGGLMLWGLFIRHEGIYFAQHLDQTLLVPRPVLNVVLFFLYGVQGKYLENFAVGMSICLCYSFAQKPGVGDGLMKWAKRLSPGLFGLGLLVITFAAIWHFQVLVHHMPLFSVLDPWKTKFDWLNEMVIAIGYGTCMAAILFGPRALKWLFETRLLGWIGLISYGIYMWHLPLLTYFNQQVVPHLPAMGIYRAYAAHWLWALLVVIPVAALSYLCVERPFIRLGNRRREAKVLAPVKG
ncbi:MAG TPA: acyltransferase [Ktedonosporobacter sp.]|nr:acyltransferase [Ktedonosporobacter sp.]